MKRLFVYAAALALILCLANGAMADVEMDVSVWGGTVYIWDDMENGEIEPTMSIAEGMLYNFEQMSGAYGGEPTWSFQQTSGPDIGLYIVSDEHSEWFMLTAARWNYPKNDCTITAVVTCTWGGQTKQEEITVQFVKVDPPQGVTIPKTVDVQAGQSVTLTGGFLPSGWPSETGGRAYFSLNGFEGTNGMLAEHVSEDCWAITGVTPGVYTGSMYISFRGVTYNQTLTVRVTDENGQVPLPTLSLLPESMPDILFWPGAQLLTQVGPDTQTAYLEDAYWPVYIEGTDEIRALAMENPPVWSAEIVSGPQFQFAQPEAAGGGQKANLECKLRITAVPAQPGDTVVRFTCDFLEQTAQQDVTFHFVQIPEPTGVDIPGVVTMEVGETRILSCDFLPAGAYEGYSSTGYFVIEFHNSGLFLRDWSYSGASGISITALNVGEVTCRTSFVLADVVYMNKYVTYRSTPPAANGKTVYLPAGTKTVEASAFEGAAMETLVLPQGCGTIGSRAFAGCQSLKKVIAPDSLTVIADDAFAGCAGVTFYAPFRATTVSQFAQEHGFSLVQG